MIKPQTTKPFIAPDFVKEAKKLYRKRTGLQCISANHCRVIAQIADDMEREWNIKRNAELINE